LKAYRLLKGKAYGPVKTALEYLIFSLPKIVSVFKENVDQYQWKMTLKKNSKNCILANFKKKHWLNCSHECETKPIFQTCTRGVPCLRDCSHEHWFIGYNLFTE